MVHQEYGRRLLDRMATELKEVAAIERNPLVEGRNMIMIMSPLAKKQSKGPQGPQSAQEGEPQPATPAAATSEEPSSDAQDQNP
jgi:translation initiation factor IF-3